MQGGAVGAVRLALYLLWTAALIPVQAVAVGLDLKLRLRLPQLYHRVCCRILGFRLKISGAPARGVPVLFLANHASYLDITVLGAAVPGSFVAKSEVAQWPFFGLLAKLQRTVFVDRKRSSLDSQRTGIAARLAAGENVILFPEGTSNDGVHLKPFKSALLAAAEPAQTGRPVLVQPVSVVYARLNGLPIRWSERQFYAWYGDMDLAAHLWRVVGLGETVIDVVFHPPLPLGDGGDRKSVGAQAHAVIAARLAAVNSGRVAA